ncbi:MULTISPECIES: M20 family metallopeptidase [Brevibacillus]|jgi:amidohydrolase|uniref:N-acyl-L-amino acid amidohydrolase n=1 Tax=Brevibacillus borstelensis AK1 TaxID=1300222 RepID=M8ECG4_9BACL|nr:M20 family metallopeptidase [Brevibacillus borstelensis]EMT53165.1 N-acyl-L-amino acid amidohydrolase [Brevibacillus borstelensis AK1]KKX55447.1 N-acyl-L-amino acid amidohydrolase [Brevibacillus borstelensis cifa_chp40]MCM3558823.1 M20 family metallopeptidase [Brevibacillus borstelensis]MED1744141.1 M20 family metallopeptidase [Brevibacillus borstelensis]MED1850686.1 M20 family metallopeptidase [Brevibacillus borstelensis]
MTTTATLNQEAEQLKEQVIAWRRYLHQNPELSFHEEKTAQFVYDTLVSFGNLDVTRPTKTSVMARLIGSQPGRVLAMRADMDALPITEENTFAFVSTNPGVMHACGHDGHTAMLLGTAKILSGMKDRIKGEVRFLFQHAEELFPGGAEEMVQAGVMDGVDMVIGTHLWAPMEFGKVGICPGPMMAAPDTFYITITGKGGHAALPHQTVDSIAIAAQVVTNLQHIVSRNTDPLDNLVISVTQFIGGTTHNVIPGSVSICGTVRSFDQKLRDSVPALMERVVKGITEAHGATYEFKYEYGYRPVINDEEVTRLMESIVTETLGEEWIDHMKPNMGGEDFSAFQQKAPGCFFYVGAGNQQKGIVYPHHHPRFTVDEDALEVGVKIFVNAAHKIVMA